MPISSHNSNGGKDDRNTENQFHEADDAAEEATRILPRRGSETKMPGKLVGVANKDYSGVTEQEEEKEEEKTVFVPAGTGPNPDFDPAVGWLVVIDGPGRGNFCPVHYGQNTIGRGENQRIRLNFGDARITRDTHAFLIYDDVARKFFLRDNGKANLVRHNHSPVMSPTEVKNGDQISIGSTVLLLVTLCGPEFDWLAEGDEHE